MLHICCVFRLDRDEVVFEFVFEDVGGLEINAVSKAFHLEYFERDLSGGVKTREVDEQFVSCLDHLCAELLLPIVGSNLPVKDVDELAEDGGVNAIGVLLQLFKSLQKRAQIYLVSCGIFHNNNFD